MPSKIYLIPIALAEDGYGSIPSTVKNAMHGCDIFFAENLRTARRAFRKMDRTFDIDAKTWHETGNEEEKQMIFFREALEQGKTIGIVSESGCPGIADPGQKLIAVAHQEKAKVIPLSGPSSILLALMASGMNGQHFTFNGYLPIEGREREKKIKELERKALHENCTQIFIETPYRNNQLLQAILNTCQPTTKLCIAVDLTSAHEWVITQSMNAWKKSGTVISKVPAIFIIGND